MMSETPDEASRPEPLRIAEADLSDPRQAADALAMIRAYARDPFGQDRDLDDSVRSVLIDRLKAHTGSRVFLAYDADRPVGVVVCFLGFSTFAARPLINIHDIYVDPSVRCRGVARRLLEAVEAVARALDCCALTLEVLEGNSHARRVYERFGFSPGAHVDARGRTLFCRKSL